ncbi:hypothetical protein NARC_60122 [Candidatus Nitrosocosmicus arcticus]|uniref:PD-(D/E)XK endonuclease-like domain-containing protein n=2 Tax=Candidatus Nitrosocosmicus arcticus TaxID=2035267 RepID=A0A557SVV3_9ARCH|nr:hypothetical protein NARC_60122 [Candidatus Nitrosocosmicus arcticus]
MALIWGGSYQSNTKKEMPIIISKDYRFLHLLRTNLKVLYSSRKRKPEDRIHVSDILSGSCLRKAFYARVVKDYDLTVEDIDNFVRGESSEYVLVGLADIGVTQKELLFEDDLIARPDLMTGSSSHKSEFQNTISTKKDNEAEIIVEFKDTKSFERLTPDNKRFKSYLRQLLYYLVISGYDTGILCIRYSNNRRLVWIKRDTKGDYFFSPKTNGQEGEESLTEIESWTVILEKGSNIRDILKEEIRTRVSLLKSALDSNSDAQLPKVAEEWKCIKCPFRQTCNPSSVISQDSEIDILDEKGLIVTIDSN